MGGFGSGRKWGLACTDECLSIDIRRWQRDGLLTQGRSFNWQWLTNGETSAKIDVIVDASRIILRYRIRKYGCDWKEMDYSVRLTTTPCTYGGERFWFICPATSCNRRVALLYGYDEIFACRHCYQLAYRCQRETDNERLIRKAEKIRRQLQWEPGILNPGIGKPKGMHWKTFFRLQTEHNSIVEKSFRMLESKLHFKIY